MHKWQQIYLFYQHILQPGREARQEAGIRNFSLHDMCQTFISGLLDAGVDFTTVSKMAGHASVITTARYDRWPEEAKRNAAGLLYVPYHR